MMKKKRINSIKTGSDLLIAILESLGTEHVFGIPGTQDFSLYEAYQRSTIRPILTTHELSAVFMANGYFRSSGKVGVVSVIQGPGFTNSLTGLAEARFDSAAVICLVFKKTVIPNKKFQSQILDQISIAKPIVKESFEIKDIKEIKEVLQVAFRKAISDEPGPVLVELSSTILLEKLDHISLQNLSPTDVSVEVSADIIAKTIQNMKKSPRILLLIGQGARKAVKQVYEIAQILNAPVLSTTSGRGLFPEDHPLSFSCDFVRGRVQTVNDLIDSCDLVIALGCKFSENSTKGFELKISPKKLIHVDASDQVLNANYAAKLRIRAKVESFLNALLDKKNDLNDRNTGWTTSELGNWRIKIHSYKTGKFVEPKISGINPPSADNFFATLRKVLTDDSCLVTDSGYHQILARRYYEVLNPGGLIIPTNYQSMAFGISAAIGVKLANPQKNVVALVGDGGFAMSGMELITAVREKIDLTIIVFNDKFLNLIRLMQLQEIGRYFAVETGDMDYAKFCASIGVHYNLLKNNLESVMKESKRKGGVSLIEVKVKDSGSIQNMKIKKYLKATAKRLVSR